MISITTSSRTQYICSYRYANRIGGDIFFLYLFIQTNKFVCSVWSMLSFFQPYSIQHVALSRRTLHTSLERLFDSVSKLIMYVAGSTKIPGRQSEASCRQSRGRPWESSPLAVTRDHKLCVRNRLLSLTTHWDVLLAPAQPRQVV